MKKWTFSDFAREKLTQKAALTLWQKQGKPGLEYLIEKRQINETILRDFTIGYIPEKAKHGLAGRIILPLRDPSGHLIAITTRAVVSSPLPKYWHEAYDKQAYFYGLDRACDNIMRRGYALIVEGQFDVLQCFSNGIDNSVAVCGSQISKLQAAVLQRYCDRLVFLFDSDKNRSGEKGVNRSLRTIGLLSPTKKTSSLPFFCAGSVNLPLGYDPDDFLKERGPDDMMRLVKPVLDEIEKNSI